MPSKKKHPHHAEAAAPRNPEPLGEAALVDALTKLGAPGLGGNGGAGPRRMRNPPHQARAPRRRKPSRRRSDPKPWRRCWARSSG